MSTFIGFCSGWIPQLRPHLPRDKPKIIRALEVRLETGKPLTEHLQASRANR